MSKVGEQRFEQTTATWTACGVRESVKNGECDEAMLRQDASWRDRILERTTPGRSPRRQARRNENRLGRWESGVERSTGESPAPFETKGKEKKEAPTIPTKETPDLAQGIS